jgi:hypothetical protein
MPYWFNVATGEVETEENRSRNDDVLGPYESRAEAAAALEIAAERTKAWDKDDEDWENYGADRT